MDEETVIIEAADPKCPVCGDQIDFVETQANDEEGEWRCEKGHWSRLKSLVTVE